MDILRLYAKDDKEKELIITVKKKIRDDINIKFDPDKCAKVSNG